MSQARPYKDSRKREESLENEKDQLANELELSRNDREPDTKRTRTEDSIRPDTIAVPRTDDTTREEKDNASKEQSKSSRKVQEKEDGEDEAETLDDVTKEDRYKASPGST